MTKQWQEHLSKRGDKRLFWQEKLSCFVKVEWGHCILHTVFTQHQVFSLLEKKVSDARTTLLASLQPYYPVIKTNTRKLFLR
jgi:hypothetical protein